MRILINDEPVNVTVDFETKKAPCEGCLYYAERSESSPPTCTVEGRPLSGSVIETCEKLKWFKPAE